MVKACDNNVDRNNQINGGNIYYINGDELSDETKVLIFGNSITRHGIKPEIGWFNDCGMAASSINRDYVHALFDLMKTGGYNPCFLVSQAAKFEADFYKRDALDFLSEERGFKPDIIILRLGDNVYHGDNDGAIIPAFESLINACAVKSTRVIVTGSYFVNENIEPLLKKLSDKNGYEFVELCDISLKPENRGGKDKFWHDGVALHPGDNGMKIIAERLLKKIKKLSKGTVYG